MKTYRILVVDDHTLIREFLARLLNLEPGLEVIGNTGESARALELARTLRPDLILLDVKLASPGGPGLLPGIRKYAPAAKVIMVAAQAQPLHARKLIRDGAKGYVTKHSGSEEFMEAIREVLAGKTYLCAEVKEAFVKALVSEDDPHASIRGLSQRELEIISYLRKGMSSRQIGAALFINPKTVEVHRHNILKKLKVKNTAALIQYLNEKGI